VLPSYRALSEPLSRDRAEPREAENANPSEEGQEERSAPEPATELGFIERRLVDFDRNGRNSARDGSRLPRGDGRSSSKRTHLGALG
jgi:hypothetical protein